jgi:hypothetical protein
MKCAIAQLICLLNKSPYRSTKLIETKTKLAITLNIKNKVSIKGYWFTPQGMNKKAFKGQIITAPVMV